MLDQKCFLERRKKLFSLMESNSVAVLFSAPEYERTYDTHYPYRQNSDFYYLTGFMESDAVAVFVKESDDQEYILFNRPSDPDMEKILGKFVGQDNAKKEFLAEQSYSITELDQRMPEILKNKERLYYAFGRQHRHDRQIQKWISALRASVRRGVNPIDEIFNLETIVHEMRMIKSPEEIQVIQKAIDIGAAAHLEVIKHCCPGIHEYELEAILVSEYIKRGARQVSFETIVAGGKNACTLHYINNQSVLNDGDLVLLDAGCEYQNYASDITRTFPTNGHFTPEQKAIYEIVLQAQLAAIAEVKPGNRWNQNQAAAIRVITEGLRDLGIIKGKVDQLIQDEAYKPYYMHNIGHWLGMDVHDVGAYKINNEWRELKPGILMTIEPGIYIPEDDESVDSRWRGIGVRIEDDVLVTPAGNKILTSAVPKKLEEIESLIGSAL